MISFNSLRRFGCELEFNSFDNRNFYLQPLAKSENPEGVYKFGELISKLNFPVRIDKYHHTHNNTQWIIKPDRSCGIEICTPVCRGVQGILDICKVIDSIAIEPKVLCDSRCSFHIHVDVSDLTSKEVAQILTWWVKFEPVFFDAMKNNRKTNYFCQCIGFSDLFSVDSNFDESSIIQVLSISKYFSINSSHYAKDKRKTLEIRIADGEYCFNSYYAKNWIKFILYFFDVASKSGWPINYKKNTPWSGFCWLDLEDLIKFMFLHKELSLGMQQMRNWFLFNIKHNICGNVDVWSKEKRYKTIEQLNKYINLFGIKDEIAIDTNKLVYSEEYLR